MPLFPKGAAAAGFVPCCVALEAVGAVSVNDEKNGQLYLKYKALADHEDRVIFGGRLAEYKYYDMAPVMERAFTLYHTIYE